MAFLSGYAAFLDAQYWLNPTPVPLGPTLAQNILAFFGFFIVASIVLAVVAHVLRKKDELLTDLLRRVAGPTATAGMFGLVALFFAYEQSPFLGMRLWFLLVLAYFLVRMAFIAAYVVRTYPGLRATANERARLEQYLPRAK